MKFPVLFRVFAALNILGFLALLIQTGLFFSTPDLGIVAISLSIMATVWTLISSFLWFFGSRYSYHLLYLTALLLLVMGGVVIMAGLDRGNASVFFTLFYGAVILIYSVFLLVSSFYKPIREWNAQAAGSPVLPLSLFGGLIVLAVGGMYFVDMKLTKYQVLDVYGDADPFQNVGRVFDLRGTTEMDAIVISTDHDLTGLEGTLYFADNFDALSDSQFFRMEKVKFELVGHNMLANDATFFAGEGELSMYFAAKFPMVRAKRIAFYPNNTGMPEDKAFVFSTLHTVRFFEVAKDRYQLVEDESNGDVIHGDDYETYDGDAEYYAAEAEAQEVIENKDLPDAIALSPVDRDQMITDFFQEIVNTYDDSRYYYNTDVPRVILQSKAFGYYNTHQHVFRFKSKKALYGQVGRMDPADERDHTLNDLLWIISGRGIYLNLEDHELPFYGLNPAFVEWANEYLVPEPGSEYLGQTAQAIYDGMFRRAMWQLATAREYFDGDDHLDQAAQDYLAASRETGFYGPGYLYKTYVEGKSSAPIFGKLYNKFPPTEGEYFYFTEEVAIGFWLRRRLDGSDDEVWAAIKSILKDYDSYPFE